VSDERGATIVQLTAFFVGDEEYVVDIMRVREIIRPISITPVRRGPRFVEGVINLRGAVIPVIDMRLRFGMDPTQSPHRKIVIMSIDRRTFGLIVDRVTEVIRIPRHAIRPAPELLGAGRAPFFSGVCRFEDRDLILLNVRNIIASDEEIEPPSAEALASAPRSPA
jgi:purine-binding chemotaxis protein CheW